MVRRWSNLKKKRNHWKKRRKNWNQPQQRGVGVASRRIGAATFFTLKINLDNAVLQGSKTGDSLDNVPGLKAQIPVRCFQGSAQLRRYLKVGGGVYHVVVTIMQ